MANNANPFVDMATMIQKFKVPGFDMAPIIESRRKDMEALVEANKSVYEAVQALARRQTEIMTETTQGIQDSAKGLAGGGAPDAALVGNAYQKAIADMKELAEMVRKSQVDAMAGITARATQSVEEMKLLMQPK